MAAFDNSAPRKRIVTYGKAVRRRIHDFRAPSLEPRSPTPDQLAPTAPPNMQTKTQTSPASSKSSPVTTHGDIFDMSSSEDELLPIRRKPLLKVPQKLSTFGKTTKPASVPAVKEPQAQKIEKAIPTVAVTGVSGKSRIAPGKLPSRATSQAPMSERPVMPMGKQLAARPKPLLSARMTKKIPSSAMPSATPAQPKAASGEETLLIASHISLHGHHTGKGLLESEQVDLDHSMTGIELPSPPSLKAVHHIRVNDSPVATLSRPAGVSKPWKKRTLKVPRRRLIDALAEQEDDEEDSSGAEDVPSSQERSYEPNAEFEFPRPQSVAPEIDSPPMPTSASQKSQVAGPKFTYSRQRSLRSVGEPDFMSQLSLGIPLEPPARALGRRGSPPKLNPLASFHEEETEKAGLGSSVRTVHELRQAGANSRFVDEVEDLLERIGNPIAPYSSSRRSGLLDLASKMKDKSFSRHFRAHGTEQRLFMHLGQETDVVAGFIIVSLLVAAFVEGSMPHIVEQLRRQGATRLLIRLLDAETSILKIAKERKSNMSKVAQSLLSDHHKFLLGLPTWEHVQPQVLSPRTIALKCLEIMVRQSREVGDSGDIISKELTSPLFNILTCVDKESAWNLPQEQDAIDLYLALSTLESHSLVARTVQDESLWLNDYLPIISNTLKCALQRPIVEFGQVQTLALRLTLNVTNKNSKACDVFTSEDLLHIVGRTIVSKFKEMAQLWTEEEIHIAVDHLILLLGAMINFAAWSPPDRLNLQILSSAEDDALDGLIGIFVDNREKTFLADSQHETAKNVPFGYLSVLLGHLCLVPGIDARVRSRTATRTLRPLLTSINEFIDYHRAADSLTSDEEGHQPQVALTRQLESLVEKLKALKAGA